MKLVVRERRSGKSLELLHTSEMTQARIITATEHAASYLDKTAEMLGLDIPEPMSAKRYKTISRGMRDEKLLIDDAELILTDILSEYFERPIVGATISVPERINRRTRRK